MGGAAARTLVILRFCRAVYGTVKEQIAAVGNIKTALFKVVVCRSFKTHGFKLAFHNSHRNKAIIKPIITETGIHISESGSRGIFSMS